MLVAPNDQVQEAREEVRLDGVLLAVAVLHAILVQHEYVEPVAALLVRGPRGPQPTSAHDNFVFLGH